MKTYAVVLLATCHSVLAAKSPACSSGIYKKLASYSVIKPVSTFCVSKFPPVTQTSVVSTATTITSTSTLTETTTIDTTVLATSTATEFTTVTITAAAANGKRGAKAATPSTPVPFGKVATTSAQPCPELVALKLLASNVVATACSCIISTPTVTSTKAATFTANAQATMTMTIANTIISTVVTTSTATATATVAPAPVENLVTCNNPSALGCSAGVTCSGSTGSCICEQTVEGINLCIDEGGQTCGSQCSSSAACGVGYRCVTSTCCPGTGTCLQLAPGGRVCTNGPAKMMRMLRGSIEKRVVIGYPLHLPPTGA
ncbi:hypothetical protein HBI79_158460 [Parastagonospora nodorum]|nr:hypothetical protein HBI79_158460 [Parastagonospora nodorum]